MDVEKTLRFNIRAWGCGIKANTSVELSVAELKPVQGNPLVVKFHFNFDAEDMPNKLEIMLEQDKDDQSIAYALESVVEEPINKPELDLELSLDYNSAEPGPYRLEVNFRHAEYGTELAMVQPVIFQLKSPAIDVAYCDPTSKLVSKGMDLQLKVGLKFPAPQKTRGIVFGRLVANNDLVNNLYELEPKRISFLGEKEIVWKLRIPHNESSTGSLNAIVEFKSKDAIVKQIFENVIEIRQDRLIRVNSMKSSKDVLSPDDGVVLQVELENIGLKKCDIEIEPEIRKYSKTAAKQKAKASGKTEAWTLPLINKELDIDEKQGIDIPWFIPKDAKNGYYILFLKWKITESGESKTVNQTIFEIRKHHEVTIEDAIVQTETFRPGTEATASILISNRGTKSKEKVNVILTIFDIFNQEGYSTSTKMSFSENASELNLVWPIPEDQEPGKYDLVVQVEHENMILQKRKFSKFFNIENPIKFELHIKLPGGTKSSLKPNLNKYLLENESVTEKIKLRSLDILNLNSNTHLFTIDDGPVFVSKSIPDSKKRARQFIKLYFSYLAGKEVLDDKSTEKILKHWSKLGYCWTNLVLMDKHIIKGPGIKQLQSSSRQKLRFSVFRNIARAIFKNTLGLKRPYSMDLDKIFKNNIVADKGVTSQKDFKTLHLLYRLVIEEDYKFNNTIRNKLKSLDSDGKNCFKYLQKCIDLLNQAIKFRFTPNSKILKKKFNKNFNTWFNDLKRRQIERQPDNNLFDKLASFYNFILLYLVTEIEIFLFRYKKEKYIDASDFNKYLIKIFLYQYISIMYKRCRAELDGLITPEELSELNNEISIGISETKDVLNLYWQLNNRWQVKYTNYLKNMKNRLKSAFVYDHVMVTTNPIVFEGMRGGIGKSKLILGNSGLQNINLNATIALPSNHWGLVEPGANVNKDVYELKMIKIPPKQTKEILCAISVPNTLSFTDYKGILKLKSKPFELLPEID